MSKTYYNIAYRFISDPGHGWLEVPKKVIDHLGFKPSMFDYYSPETDMVYLEEDCQAPRFCKLFKQTFGEDLVTTDEFHEDCNIRRMSRCL